ncbi:uncharacterized protein LOC129961713 [Argiope bruennichi]|uniref:uncharacterized protein LOC129961713 n=1 Tax=Argiope bruennichi TaxID=94029 RepID=UPI002494F645|nr:uncharacterized protein LOC129961713 [Argiope bruennichi]
MEGKAEDTDTLNCMFDDFYYNSDKQGRGEYRSRSSILKQTKNLNLDICELEETEIRRKSQNPKRVSFADTFQVKEYPTGNIYDIPGRHELDASKNSSNQIDSCFETEKQNMGVGSRDPLSVVDFGFIDNQEMEVSKVNCARDLAISFLEAEKENIGIIAKYSSCKIPNVKTSSEPMRDNSNFSETSQNVQKNSPTKITPSTISLLEYDSNQFLNETRTNVDEMDITCLPSPKTDNYFDEISSRARLTANDMETTCVSGNDFLDESPSTSLSEVFLENTNITSDGRDENKLLSFEKLNMETSKKALSLSFIEPAISFENIKLKSFSSNSGYVSPCFDVLSNIHSSFLGKSSEKHLKSISGDLIGEENVNLPSAINRIKTNFDGISSYKYSGMDACGTESHAAEKETFEENSHYSQNNAHGVKFMKIFSEKENTQNRIQVSNFEKLHFPSSSITFLENKENVGFNRKRKSIGTSELGDASNNKGVRHNSTDEKILHINSENDPKTNRHALNRTACHSESDFFNENNEPLFTHSTNAFPISAEGITCKSGGSRMDSVDLENSFDYLSEDLKFKNRKYEHSIFDPKSLPEDSKTHHFESEGMELTSVVGCDDFHFVEKEKEFDKSLNLDHSSALIGTSRTCHYTSDKMELTCAGRSNIELKEMPNRSSLNNINDHESSAISEFNDDQLDSNAESKNSKMHNSTFIEKGNKTLNSRLDEGHTNDEIKKFINLQTNSKFTNQQLNDYQSDNNEVMEETLISHEMQLTCTFKTSVASPFLQIKDVYLTQSSESCFPDFKTPFINSNDDLKVKRDVSNLSKPSLFNDIDKSFLVEQRCVFQSNTMDITCNNESSLGNSFNFEKSTNYNHSEDEKLVNSSIEFSLNKKHDPVENHKTHHFDSEEMELTCVAGNDEFSLVNDSFEVKMQKEFGKDLNFDQNVKLLDSSRTHHFTSDKMELTCAVKSCTQLKKTLNDESCLKGCHERLSTSVTLESDWHHDEPNSQINQTNALHSLDVEKENIFNSEDKRKQHKSCHSVKTIPGECSGLDNSCNLSFLQNSDNKCNDQTFNSHEMELTLMTDKSHKLQSSPFFLLSSHPESISKEKGPFDFQKQDKKFQIAQSNLTSLSEKMEENLQESISCVSPNNKMLQTKQPFVKTDLVPSEDNGDVWDIVLKPLNSQDAKLKMPPGLKHLLSRTPGALYTLRKKRQQITKNFLKKCILSPDVQSILKKSKKFDLKQPLSEMKVYSPISYKDKKSLSFHSFGMTDSFTEKSKENFQLPKVQPFNSSFKTTNQNSEMVSFASLPPTSASILIGNINFTSESKDVSQLPTAESKDFSQLPTAESKDVSQLPIAESFLSSRKAINENSGITSVLCLTPARISILMEDNCTSELKENAQLPSVQSFHSSLKDINENSRMMSIASLTPTSTIPLIEDNFATESKENAQHPTVESFNSSLKAINENSGMTSITSFNSAPTSAFTSFARSEASLNRQSNKVAFEENCTQNFSKIEDKQKFEKISVNENESLQLLSNSILDTAESLSCKTLSELFPAKILQEKCLLKNESNLVQAVEQDLHLPSEAFILTSDIEEKCYKNSHGSSFSNNQDGMKLKDPFVAYELDTLNTKIKCNDQNAINNQDIPTDFTRAEIELKCHDVKNSVMLQEKHLRNTSLDSNVLESQKLIDLNVSERPVLKSTKITNLSEMKVQDFQNENDPVVLEKTRIKDNISDLSSNICNLETTDLQDTNDAFVSKVTENGNGVSELSKSQTSSKIAISKNSGNLFDVETSSSYKKNSPEKILLKVASPKQSENMHISINHPAENCHELKSDCTELASPINKSSDQQNNFYINSCSLIASLNANSPCKINNQNNADPKVLSDKMEISDVIWRTSDVNESVKDITVHVNESESSKETGDMSINGCCSSVPLQDLDSLRNKFEEASKGTHWKLESLNKDEIVFKLNWGVWLYRCVILIHVSGTNVNESTITLTPCFNDPDDEYETLGYKFFQFLAKDEIVSFSLFSDSIIEKLAEYSNIAERVETLMRDIMHVSIAEIYKISDDLDPLELCVEILNDNHMSHLLITFHVNLRTYPMERIIPEVKHIRHKDITKEVQEAITNVEPGEDYLWKMVKLANKL